MSFLGNSADSQLESLGRWFLFVVVASFHFAVMGLSNLVLYFVPYIR